MDAMVSAAETTPAPPRAGERASPQRPRAFASTRQPERTQLLLHGKADGRGGFRVTHHALAPPGAAAAQLLLDGEAAEAAEAAGLREGAGGAPAPRGAPIGEAVAHYPATEGITSTEILTL